jgi:hypothetical protein
MLHGGSETLQSPLWVGGKQSEIKVVTTSHA